ncbi:MAG: hypothetical protein JXB20_03840 [Bacilli bacterium]|nr:hypothetical protein [Bacilli bacterium]MBN2696678.1 hypothetical protein [Bacilli bacterium]
MKIKNLNMIEKTFLYLWPFIILFGLGTYLIGGNFDLVVGFLLGAFTSMLMNSVHYRILKSAFLNHKEVVKSISILLYLVKFVMYGIVLYFAITSDKWNEILTFVGLLSYRLVLFPIVFITLRKDKNGGDANVGL